ncbi:MAG: DUF362 domain-containing protein [Phycisphaerae bacterium]|nr:DUF362 domain-containing protein [Phycisphaerae bacterium]
MKSCENFPAETLRYTGAFARLLNKNEQFAFLCNTSNQHLDYKSHGIVCAYRALDACAISGEYIPFMTLDGIYGEHEISRKNHRDLEADVYLAGELPNLDGVVSVCCFAPSMEMSVCGSIINLGQGLASKKGKIHQRTTSCPQVNVKKCYACRRCVRECPSHAIAIVDGHVAIDSRKCIKCGKCVEIAYYGGITYDWNATPEHYYESVARHAKGVLSVLAHKVVCVNIIMSGNGNGSSFSGAMVSLDPVAVDCATLDFCENHQLLPLESVQCGRGQVNAAHSAGVGNIKYKIQTVAY